MRHSIHIMFGQGFVQTLKDVEAYFAKYGESEHFPYFTAMLWDNKKATVDKFEELHQQKINLDNRGNNNRLHYCLYFPFYDATIWNEVEAAVKILNGVGRPVDIDLFGFCADLSKIVSGSEIKRDVMQKIENDTIKSAVTMKKKPENNVSHVIVMQNRNNEGFSLNLTNETLVKIIGEFALLCVENYSELFGSVQKYSDCEGIGLSVLSFDKYYYLDYLVRKVFLYIMDREGIHGVDNQEKVDIVDATNRAEAILVDKLNILSKLYDDYIKGMVRNGKPEKEIVAEITPILKKQIERFGDDCESFITDEQLSIPIKRAIFSALLGQDDEFFDNFSFTEQPLEINDIDKEGITLFVNANNCLLDRNEDELKAAAVLSSNGEKAIIPLKEIKRVRGDILNTTSDIRRLEEEIEQLEKQVDNIEESKKSLTQDGFIEFGSEKYQLLPEIEEVPLEEDYISHTVKSTAVDLREGFTPIKDQGDIGSCVAFSLTSIYEYILKSNRQIDCDLSEAFLYYNARKMAGDENEVKGCCTHLAIKSLVEYGICIEEKWRYKYGKEEDANIQTYYTTEPSQEAYADALLRRVRKAVNVKLSLQDIRSALDDGYPIEIGTTVIKDQFDKLDKTGVISYPTNEQFEKLREDRKNQINHGHAMVICGFDDTAKVFIIRNSWGTDWGDKGYCYMPYSYILNEELTRYAYAIIEVATVSARGIVKRTALPFGDDVRMLYAIKCNLLEEERQLLARLEGEFSNIKAQYHQLHESLLNPHYRSLLTDGTETRLKIERQELIKQHKQAEQDMDEQLDAFRAETISRSIRIGIPFVVTALIAGVIHWLAKKGKLLLSSDNQFLQWATDNGWIVVVILLGVMVLAIGGFVVWRIVKRKSVKDEDENYDVITGKKTLQITGWFILVAIVAGIYANFCNTDFGADVISWLGHKSGKIILWSLIFGVVIVSWFVLLRGKRQKSLKVKLQEVCERFDVLVRNKEIEQKENKLHMHFAGMVLSENSKTENILNSKYQFMQSFLINLNTWYTLESESLDVMQIKPQAPFISIINNETLDVYFDQNKEKLTKNISLCAAFTEKYVLSKEGITEFQKFVEQTIRQALASAILDFTIYDCFAEQNERIFREVNSQKDILADLEVMSNVFVQHISSINTTKSLFLHTRNEKEMLNWNRTIQDSLGNVSSSGNIVSQLKLVMVQRQELQINDIITIKK